MKIKFEYTDTFGGEANYSWVRRETIDVPEGISDQALIRKAKAFAGISGVRSYVDKQGDMIALRPSGMCTVLFITWE
jgi:hypothetical protein